MIIFPVFGKQQTTPVAETRADDKPVLAWAICPVTQRPVMVWTLPEPEIAALPVAACA
jgi:hypothetical protein